MELVDRKALATVALSSAQLGMKWSMGSTDFPGVAVLLACMDSLSLVPWLPAVEKIQAKTKKVTTGRS